MAQVAKSMREASIRLNKFSFKMQKAISEGEGSCTNIAFSPFSIYSALAMLGLGAEHKTRKEIASALEWQEDDFVSLLDTLMPLNEDLSKQDNGSTLDIANKLWISENVNVLEKFKENIIKYFKVEIGKEDFERNPDTARKNINEWVSQQTGQHIKELFSSPLDTMTRLVLANALYFRGDWEKEFDKRETFKHNFYVSKDEVAIADFMYKNDRFSTFYDSNYTVNILELPYKGKAFSMVFVVPYDIRKFGRRQPFYKDVSEVEADIKNKPEVLDNWISKLAVGVNVDVFIPKFEIKFGLDLIPKLKELGINDAFEAGKADLSNMDGNKDLYVSAAVHKSFVQVDETGTEAAAATGMAMCLDSMSPEIMINQPFLFYIIHKKYNAIIFSGKIQNPLG